MTAAPLPSKLVFAGIHAVDKRVEALVWELCTWYERNPWFEHIRAERALHPPVEEHMTLFEQALEQLFLTAARCTDDEARTLAALSDAAVYRNLRRAGMPPSRASMRITDAVLAWLRSNKRRRTS